ncbi:hypothetical protein [Sediminispirochaeta smaragdinae]|uniref:Lipoprotein n=1 Tax=Sediminispirochaeta smaragdinae (strain DSM 11293 / JCM 15392 / SEBR 4228) TaxID=573413 RepID=E1R200_SEDSS|nr:hypothetical protein [Sediminispirochaeta smaragdinae]ADK81885.1 hypothetical protein Spirs_2782 [Sediminispirochaeta smaragdinae DSM 11293]
MKRAYLLFISLTFLLFGCATYDTSFRQQIQKDVVFFLPELDDPLNIGKVISQEFDKRNIEILRIDPNYVEKGTYSADAIGKDIQRIAVHFKYRYYFDVVHNVITDLSIRWVEISSGLILAEGTASGDSPYGANKTVSKVINSMLDEYLVER